MRKKHSKKRLVMSGLDDETKRQVKEGRWIEDNEAPRDDVAKERIFYRRCPQGKKWTRVVTSGDVPTSSFCMSDKCWEDAGMIPRPTISLDT
jgi:hypothetical protein